MYQKRACRNLQFGRCLPCCRQKCIRKEPAAIYNFNIRCQRLSGSVSEKSLPQSTISWASASRNTGVYQKRACRNLQLIDKRPAVVFECIRKEPAAIYNHSDKTGGAVASVSEKSLPQSTIVPINVSASVIVYQKRACRNLQCRIRKAERQVKCIRKEPAAIYNHSSFYHSCRLSVSEKSLPQSTIEWEAPRHVSIVYQKRACRNLQSLGYI